MKYKILFICLLSFLLVGCVPDFGDSSKSKSSSSKTPTNEGYVGDPNVVTIDLDMSNFERYISYTKHEGWTGPAGFSPYEAWLEFKGLLSIGVYDASVIYLVGDKKYNFKLDVSGGGTTNYFDRNATCKIINVSGTVTYRI